MIWKNLLKILSNLYHRLIYLQVENFKYINTKNCIWEKEEKIELIFASFTMYCCKKGYTIQFGTRAERSVLGAKTGFSEKCREKESFKTRAIE